MSSDSGLTGTLAHLVNCFAHV